MLLPEVVLEDRVPQTRVGSENGCKRRSFEGKAHDVKQVLVDGAVGSCAGINVLVNHQQLKICY